MKIGIVGDLHIGIQENNFNFIDYQTESLKWVYKTFKEQGIKHIIFLGDIFDKRKHITFKTLKLLNETFGDPDFEHYCIAGNHDCYYKDTNEINSLDLLLEDFAYVKKVTQEPETINIGGTNFIFIPWINKSNYESTLKKIRDTKAKVAIAHLDLSGFELIRGIVSTHDSLDVKYLDKFDHVFTGHYHNMSENGNITYLGSLCEQTWNDVNESKYIGIYDTKSEEINYITNPYSIYKILRIKDDNIDDHNLEDFRNKNLKIYLYTNRNIKIEKFINKIIEVAYNVNVIDEQVMNVGSDLEIDTTNISILSLWQNYIKELDLGKRDKNHINRIFEDTYTKVTSGEA